MDKSEDLAWFHQNQCGAKSSYPNHGLLITTMNDTVVLGNVNFDPSPHAGQMSRNNLSVEFWSVLAWSMAVWMIDGDLCKKCISFTWLPSFSKHLQHGRRKSHWSCASRRAFLSRSLGMLQLARAGDFHIQWLRSRRKLFDGEVSPYPPSPFRHILIASGCIDNWWCLLVTSACCRISVLSTMF